MQWTLEEIASIVAGELTLDPVDVAAVSVGGISIDTRTLSPGELYVAIVGERLDGHDFCPEAMRRGAAGAIVRSDFRLDVAPAASPLIRVEDTLRALQALAADARARSRVRVAAITGSNGKTTTREMLGLVLAGDETVLLPEANRNNHIGLPLTLVELEPTHRYAVLELGMNHPGEIAELSLLARPDLALITNVGRAHIGPVGGLEAVCEAKLEIVTGLASAGPLLVPISDASLVAAAGRSHGRVETFGDDPRADHRVSIKGPDPEGCFAVGLGERDVRLRGPGRPPALAAAAALAAGECWGIPASAAADRLTQWRPFPGRMSVRRAGGVIVLDDSYNANPDSMTSALETLASVPAPGRRIAVLGEMRELGRDTEPAHRELGVELGALDHVFLTGDAMHVTAAVSRERFPHLDVTYVADIDDLLAAVSAVVSDGDVVLIKGSRAVQLERVVTHLCGIEEVG